VVETLKRARIGPMPFLRAQAADDLAAQLLGDRATPCAPLLPLVVLTAATPESPAVILPSPPETAGKSGSQF
jgi:hypothetical protein